MSFGLDAGRCPHFVVGVLEAAGAVEVAGEGEFSGEEGGEGAVLGAGAGCRCSCWLRRTRSWWCCHGFCHV